MKKALSASAALLMALTVTACGGNSTNGSSGEAEKITIGVIPIADVAPLYLAQDRGIFEDHGFDVSFQEAAGGAALVPAVVSGDYDYAFSNLVSLAIARSKGLPLKVVAPGASSTGVPGEDFGAIMTKDSSDIDRPADLAGHRVAVNALSSINEMLIKEKVEKDGGDPEAVNFVELPHPDMPAALERDEVDAIWEVEPFLTSVRADDNKEVWSLYAEAVDDLTVATYFTTEQRIAEDRDQVDRFQDAINEAFEYANANDDEVRSALSEYTTMAPETAKSIVLPAWPTKINRDSVQFQLDTARKWGLTGETSLPLEDLLGEGA